MSGTLPLELVGKILDRIPPTDRLPTLKSVSLTSATLRDVSQRRLFASTSLKMYLTAHPTSAPQVEHLRRLRELAESPRLISYVRSLEISLPHSLEVWKECTRVYGGAIIKILEAIKYQSIWRFSIHGVGFLFQDETSTSMEGPYIERLRTAIDLICGSTSLLELDMNNVPYTLLHRCEGTLLKAVHINNPAPSVHLDTAPRVRTPIKLQALLISYRQRDPEGVKLLQGYLLDPRSLIEFGSLRQLSLSLKFDRDAFKTLEALLSACQSSLEILEIHGPFIDIPDNYILNLRTFSNLRELSFSTIEGTPPHPDMLPSFLTRHIAMGNLPSTLEKLILRPTYAYVHDASINDAWLDCWRTFDEALSTALTPGQSQGKGTKLSKLVCVEVAPGLSIQDWRGAPMRTYAFARQFSRRLEEGIKGSLNDVDKKGILRCTNRLRF